MDFGFTEEQERLRDETIEFARKELESDLVTRDAESNFDRDLWRRCAEFGILGSNIPAEYGGRGRDTVTSIAIMEALGYGCRDNGLTLALNGQMWAVQEPIQQFGTEEQKTHYLPLLTSGGFGSHALSEPGSGSDSFALRTTAEKTAGGYVLNGRKTYIGLAPVCDVALVFASTDPNVGRWGITAFLVDGDAAGLHKSSNEPKMGLRTEPFGELSFEDCFVPDSARLGPEGAGASIFTKSMDWERSFIFASHVGSMARQLDDVIEYARTRYQFGEPIGKFQSVSNRVADMRLRLETSRLLLYKAAWLVDQGDSAQLHSALANLHLAESFVASSTDAIRIHGAKGYVSAYGVERDLRDALGGVIYSGTSDIQRQVVAGLLGL